MKKSRAGRLRLSSKRRKRAAPTGPTRHRVSLTKFRPVVDAADRAELAYLWAHDADESGDPLTPPIVVDEGDEPRPTLADVKKFTFKKAPVEDRDEDRLNLIVPLILHEAVHTLAIRARVPDNTAALWALERGLVRLRWIPDVQEVIDTREHIARAGSEDGEFEWTYKHGLGSPERLDIRHVGVNKGRFMALKRGLKLKPSTVGTLGLAAGLVDSPLSADLCETLRAQLVTFQRRLRQQVQIVRGVKRDLMAQPKGENTLSWAQVRVK